MNKELTESPAAFTAEAADEAENLVEAAGLLELAIKGLSAMSEHSEPSDCDCEAMEYGGCLVHGMAERLAARLNGRRTRWKVPGGQDFVGEDEPDGEEPGGDEAGRLVPRRAAP